MKKKLTKLQDKTPKIKKVDLIIIGIMILIYSIISFYHLGDISAPKTYYHFQDINDEITINLQKEEVIDKIMYYTGNNIGEISVMVSTDGINYHNLMEITTNQVLSWEWKETDIKIKASSIKFIANSLDVTLGDVILLDSNNEQISIIEDPLNPIIDELNLVPNRPSYLNSTYFDEIYFSRCAYEYVNGFNCFEWSHPPLGKLIIAIPILIFGYSPFTSRLMGNIAGILIIPIMYILGKKIFKNRKYALLSGLLMMFDTFHFAHTRIALVDSFQILFILLSILFMKNYIDLDKKASFKEKSINLLLSGFFIGCSIATKWNACYVALGLAIVFFSHLLKQYDVNIIKYCKKKINTNNIVHVFIFLLLIPLALYYLPYLILSHNIANIILIIYIGLLTLYLLVKFFKFLMKDKSLLKLFIICLISFILLPIIIYILSYILFPNINYYDKTLLGIIKQTKLMYDYHANLVATHFFSSEWYSWPIMYKPVWFYSSESINNLRMTIVDIGNPAIWWVGIIAFIYLIISSFKKNTTNRFILIFILVSYIPYIFVGRIMFMYHYFITLPFIMLAIVAFIKWITEKFKTNKLYWIYIILIIIIFVVFYPVISATNVSEDYIDSLKWFSSWYF